MANPVASYMIVFAALIGITQAHAQHSSALVDALQKGGMVIVMRHAQSPNGLPEPDQRRTDNSAGERQLDARGRETASAMGEALRRLEIPITEIISSPTYRAIETARALGFATPQTADELSSEGMAAATQERAAWLRAQTLREVEGGNRVLITHQPNIRAAFPEVDGLDDGEALIFAPNSGDTGTPVGRVKIEEWQAF